MPSIKVVNMTSSLSLRGIQLDETDVQKGNDKAEGNSCSESSLQTAELGGRLHRGSDIKLSVETIYQIKLGLTQCFAFPG